MTARLGQVLCVAALVASAPASAAEVWGTAKFEIDGKTLNILWTPNAPPNPQTRAQYPILENNDVGVVAAKSTVLNLPSLGAVVGGAMVTINKSNGVLRFMDTSYPQLIVGTCELNSATP